MSENLTVESPDFERIEKKAGIATADGIRTIWYALNQEMRERRRGVKRITDGSYGAVRYSSPAANVNNSAHDGAVWQVYEGSTSVNVTGFLAGSEGQELVMVVLGSGTITAKHNVTSEDANRIITAAGADVAITTNRALRLVYLRGRWREVKHM